MSGDANSCVSTTVDFAEARRDVANRQARVLDFLADSLRHSECGEHREAGLAIAEADAVMVEIEALCGTVY